MMSQKTKKSSVPPQQQATTTRPESPLSPAKQSRLQEKFELQNLNDRLATYIDRVRFLENENSRLNREVQCSQEVVTREVTNIKSVYESELNDTRKLLDETSRERAKLEIDAKRLWEENDNLKEKLTKKSKDLLQAENLNRVNEQKIADLQSKFSQALIDRKKLSDDLKEAEKEIDKLKKQLEDARKNLEEETLTRVDLENLVQSMKEEMSFKDQVYTQELTEVRSKRQTEISEIDGRLAEKYEARLQESLQELRDQYEQQMFNNRAEIEMLYENKIADLQNAAARNNMNTSHAIEEARQTRSKIESLNVKINELESHNSALQTRIRDLEKILEDERIRHSEEMALAEAEHNRLREEMTQQLQDYQDLMDIKISLDIEIAAYRKLLEGEESRLNITPSAAQVSSTTRSRSTPVRRTPVRLTGKRKRTILDESEERSFSDFSVSSTSKGDVEICEVCPEGKFVKLLNKGQKEVSLSGWQILRKANDLETQFKFHRSMKLEPGAFTTVWSLDCGQNHEPPQNVVMKEQKWFVSENMQTLLLNNNGEEVALHERKRSQMSNLHGRRRELMSGRGEDFLHQVGDPQQPADRENCVVM